MSFDALDLEVAAEFAGFSGAREYRPDGYSFRRLARMTDADFDALARALRVKKWKREHPEACARHAAEQARRLAELDPAVRRAAHAAKMRRWRHAHPADPVRLEAIYARARTNYARRVSARKARE